MTKFDLNHKERLDLYDLTIKRLEQYYENTNDYNVAPSLDVKKIRERVRKYNFEKPLYADIAVNDVIDALERYAVHTPHPKYFGLFNPRPNFCGILADLITAVFNPQLAAWSHSPYAAEVESYVVHEFGKKFGYDANHIDGVFATGGAEANLTAVLCAFNHSFPDIADKGLLGMQKRPVIYCSSESHHSIAKAARIIGLGYQSVRNISVDTDLKIQLDELRNQIQEDIKAGHQPFMLVGTAGTTGSGVIDDLNGLHLIAKEFGLWFHADAAYGGAVIFNPDTKHWISGIEKSDSITIDAHKWLAAPMATSLFLTCDKEILSRTFSMQTDYMPKEAKDLQITDPFSHSIQWSRRSLGLRVYLSLLIFGWKGYEDVIAHQSGIGNFLKKRLIESGWSVKNETPLPVLCFTDESLQNDTSFVPTICQEVLRSGVSWVSVYPINGVKTIRACITNFDTQEHDIETLVDALNQEREKYKKGKNLASL